jgi:hypothetical protein
MSYGLSGGGHGGGGHHGGGHHGGGGHGGGGGGHHGHHGGGHGYYGGGGWGYPYYYNNYPAVYAEPIIITQDILPDCGANPCLMNTLECQAKCQASKPLSGLGEISAGTRNLLLAAAVALGGFLALRWYGNRSVPSY